MARLSIKVIGSFEASLSGQPITQFETRKLKAILAYLAVEASQAHSREALAGIFWSNSPQTSAMKSLRHALAALRKAIGDHQAHPSFLRITRDNVQINRESDLEVDLWDFQQAISNSFTGINPKQEIAKRQAIINMYRGPFLDHLYCGSDMFEHWVQTHRTDLDHQMGEALKHLAGLYMDEGDDQAAILTARRVLALEPWDETAHRLVMLGLARSGQRNQALAQYEACRLVLFNELNVAPEVETQQLFEQIHSGALANKKPDPQPLNQKFRSSFLSGWMPLLGRERELDAVTAQLVDPACRLLTMVGPGGIGKTHLAVETAARQEDRFRHGIHFISLDNIQTVEAIPPAIAQGLGFTFYPGGTPRQELIDFLNQKELLLIIDNFEHLLQGVDLLVEILQAAPGVKMIVTSRTRLNLREEYVFPVEGLDFPTTSDPDSGRYPAVALFLAAAKQIHPLLEVTEHDSALIGQICQKLQGIPLAILLAASWMDLLSPTEILSQINNRSLDFLESNWQDLPERQRSMRTVIDTSYQLLSLREKQVFARLAVFQGGFTLPAAQAAAGATLQDLRGLVAKSLVQRLPMERYRLHEVLNQYADEVLAHLPEVRDSVRDSHCEYYAEMLAKWWDDLQGPHQFTALMALEIEIDNVLTAWKWMVYQGYVGHMRQAVFGLAFGLQNLYGQLIGTQTANLLMKAAIDRLSPLVLPAPAEFEEGARLLTIFWIIQPSLPFQHTDQAVISLQCSEDLLQQLTAAGKDIRFEKGMLLNKKGLLATPSGKIEELNRLFGESLLLFRELGELRYAANVLLNWGHASTLLGFHNKGLEMLNESLSIHQRLGDYKGMSRVLSFLREYGWMNQRALPENELLHREYLSFCQQSRQPQIIALALSELGAFYLRQGRFAESVTLLEQGIATLEQMGAIAESCLYSLFLCETQIHLGQFETAYSRCQTALSFHRKNEIFTLMGYNLILLGVASLGMEKYADALSHLEEAVIVEPAVRINDKGISLALLSLAEFHLHQVEQALTHLILALKSGIDKGMMPVLAFALPTAALQLARQGDIEWALKVYTTVTGLKYVADSRLFDRLFGSEIARMAAVLPDEVITAAKAHGSTRDLLQVAGDLLSKIENHQAIKNRTLTPPGSTIN